MTEAQARAAGLTEEEIAALHLDEGNHNNPDDGHCLLEVVSMFAGEPFSDKPACVDPVLAAFGRSWNDRTDDETRQTLKRYIVPLTDTMQGPELSVRRSLMALDWMWRVHVPHWFDLVPALAEHAATLRALPPLTVELGETERTTALEKATAARTAAKAARAAWAAWAAWDAWDARAAWDARDAWDAWDAWDAAAVAATTAAVETLGKDATYDALYAKCIEIYDQHTAWEREELHALYQRMIDAR